MLIAPERDYEYSQPDYPAGFGPLSQAKVETELANLGRQPYGQAHIANAFEDDTTLRWTTDYAMNRLYDHLLQDEATLRSHFPRFDSFPDSAKQAVFDLAWQSGRGIFGDRATRRNPERNKMWMDLSSAIGNQDWATAALLVPKLPGKERNPWRIGKFLDAAIEANMAYPGPQTNPTQRSSLYGPGGYPGYAPASTGVPNASAVSIRRTPTLEELYAMSDEDFDRNWDRVMAAARGWSLA